MANPCLSCGACCALFRVSFYWAEAADATPDGVPLEMTERAPIPHRLMMKTAPGQGQRCVALHGELGKTVLCTAHERRPSPCRNFPASFADGLSPNPRCDDARARLGLTPVTADDWVDPAPLPPIFAPEPGERPAA